MRTGDLSSESQDIGNADVIVDGAGSTLDAANIWVGDEEPTLPNGNGAPNGTDGNWTYAGGVGTLTISNGGAVSVGGKLTLLGATAQGGIYINSGGRLEVGGLASAPADTLQVDANGLIGHGLIDSNAIGETLVGNTAPVPAYSLTVANNGTITADQGTLVVDGNVTCGGQFQIDESSTLELGGSFAKGGTVNFAATDGTLQIDDPPAFHGSITGLAVGDQIILGNTNLANGNAVLRATIGNLGSAQTLDIREGNLVHTITFPDGSSTLDFPIQGAAGDGKLTGDYFQVTKSQDGTDTILTLAQGNPIDLAVNGPAARSFGIVPIDGTGITIGIISDSFNTSLNGESTMLQTSPSPGSI
jgi:hypothetical protein